MFLLNPRPGGPPDRLRPAGAGAGGGGGAWFNKTPHVQLKTMRNRKTQKKRSFDLEENNQLYPGYFFAKVNTEATRGNETPFNVIL